MRLSNCDCIYLEPTDYEIAECFFESSPIAKKPHKCCECGRIIEPGEKYIRESGKWTGEFSVYKTCIDCFSVREEMFCEGYLYTTLWENVCEYLRDVDYEISEKCLLTLTPRARNMILDIIEEDLKELEKIE